jgi:hypothetical protein
MGGALGRLVDAVGGEGRELVLRNQPDCCPRSAVKTKSGFLPNDVRVLGLIEDRR